MVEGEGLIDSAGQLLRDDERMAAEMQARTPVSSCSYILDQEEGLSSLTEDHFSSSQVCAIAPASFNHRITSWI